MQPSVYVNGNHFQLICILQWKEHSFVHSFIHYSFIHSFLHSGNVYWAFLLVRYQRKHKEWFLYLQTFDRGRDVSLDPCQPPSCAWLYKWLGSCAHSCVYKTELGSCVPAFKNLQFSGWVCIFGHLWHQSTAQVYVTQQLSLGGWGT